MTSKMCKMGLSITLVSPEMCKRAFPSWMGELILTAHWSWDSLAL